MTNNTQMYCSYELPPDILIIKIIREKAVKYEQTRLSRSLLSNKDVYLHDEMHADVVVDIFDKLDSMATIGKHRLTHIEKL